MFASVKEKLISRLSQVAHVSATLDIWTDRKMRAFMGMTVHYLDDNFQMQSQCLGVERMKGSHTGMPSTTNSTAFLLNSALMEKW